MVFIVDTFFETILMMSVFVIYIMNGNYIYIYIYIYVCLINKIELKAPRAQPRDGYRRYKNYFIIITMTRGSRVQGLLMLLSDCFCSLHFSWNCRRENIISIVERSDLKPYCDSVYTLTAAEFCSGPRGRILYRQCSARRSSCSYCSHCELLCTW